MISQWQRPGLDEHRKPQAIRFLTLLYTPPTGNPDDYYCEIWIPVERV
jgi:hypothetical protein